MKKILFVVISLFALVGCQKPENQQPDMDQRRDIAHKLIMKSMSDLQNKDLKSTIIDLETSIKVNPSESTAYLLLAQILLKVQEYDHAADFLDGAAKNFPDDGSVYFMLGIADKMAGRKLPAVLAVRHSIEIFQAQQDRDNMLKAAALLHEIIDMPDTQAAPPANGQDAAQAPEDNAATTQMPAGGND